MKKKRAKGIGNILRAALQPEPLIIADELIVDRIMLGDGAALHLVATTRRGPSDSCLPATQATRNTSYYDPLRRRLGGGLVQHKCIMVTPQSVSRIKKTISRALVWKPWSNTGGREYRSSKISIEHVGTWNLLIGPTR